MGGVSSADEDFVTFGIAGGTAKIGEGLAVKTDKIIIGDLMSPCWAVDFEDAVVNDQDALIGGVFRDLQIGAQKRSAEFDAVLDDLQGTCVRNFELIDNLEVTGIGRSAGLLRVDGGVEPAKVRADFCFLQWCFGRRDGAAAVLEQQKTGYQKHQPK